MEASATIHSGDTDVTMENATMEQPSLLSTNASTGTRPGALEDNTAEATTLPEPPPPQQPSTETEVSTTAVKSNRREPAFRRGKYKPRERKEWTWQFKPVKLLSKSDGSLEVIPGESRHFPKSRLDRTRVTRTRKRVDYMSRILANPEPWATEDMDIKPFIQGGTLGSETDPASPGTQTDTDGSPLRKRKRAESGKRVKSLPQTIAQLFHRPVPPKLESGHLQGLWHVGVPRMEFSYLQEPFPYDKYNNAHPEPLPGSLQHKSGFSSRFGRPLVPEVQLGEEWYTPQGEVDLKDHFSLDKLKDATALTRTIKVETEGLRMDVYYQRGFELAAKRVLDRIRMEQIEQEEGAKEEEARLKAEAARAELRNNWQSSLLKGGADADAVLAGRQMTWFKDMAEGMSKEAAHKAAQAEAAVAEAEAARSRRSSERAAQRKKLITCQGDATMSDTVSSTSPSTSSFQGQSSASTPIPLDAPGTSAQHQRQQLELLLQQQQLLQQQEDLQQLEHHQQQQYQLQEQQQEQQRQEQQQREIQLLEELQQRLQDGRASTPSTSAVVELEKEGPSLADYYQANCFLASMFQLKGKHANQLPVPMGPGAARILQTLLLGLETKIQAMGCHLQRQELAHRLIVKSGDKTLLRKLVQQKDSRQRQSYGELEGQMGGVQMDGSQISAHQLPLPSGARGSWMNLNLRDFERDPDQPNPLTQPVVSGPYFRLGKTDADAYILKMSGRDKASTTRSNTAKLSSPPSTSDTPVTSSSQESGLRHSVPTVPSSAAFDSISSQEKRAYQLPFVANPLEIQQSMDPFWMAREHRLSTHRGSLTQPFSVEGADRATRHSSVVVSQTAVSVASASLTAPTTTKGPIATVSIPLVRREKEREPDIPQSHELSTTNPVLLADLPSMTPNTLTESAALERVENVGDMVPAPEEQPTEPRLESEPSSPSATVATPESSKSGVKVRKKLGRPRKTPVETPTTAHLDIDVMPATAEGTSGQTESSAKPGGKVPKKRGPNKKRLQAASQTTEPESATSHITVTESVPVTLTSETLPAAEVVPKIANSTKKTPPKKPRKKAAENEDHAQSPQEPEHSPLKRVRLQ
ncbi:hypothetical protein EMPS_03113 [Entomortierella parvispora]|uniref:Uncharacterized protein n=1 Tax=Entomortierella parvispora TaxID=205924 RepID=A0A9P3LU82_9FUNG|nr:hypothetical protein EMPS_03113 [Entomortierella parvispora]